MVAGFFEMVPTAKYLKGSYSPQCYVFWPSLVFSTDGYCSGCMKNTIIITAETITSGKPGLGGGLEMVAGFFEMVPTAE